MNAISVNASIESLLPADATYIQWIDIGRQLKSAEQQIQWLIGDWINYGQAKYGEKYAEAVELLGISRGTARNYASVAARVQLSRRRDKLSFSHHAEVAVIDDVERQQDLLERAEREQLPVKALRREIKKLTHVDHTHETHAPEVNAATMDADTELEPLSTEEILREIERLKRMLPDDQQGRVVVLPEDEDERASAAIRIAEESLSDSYRHFEPEEYRGLFYQIKSRIEGHSLAEDAGIDTSISVTGYEEPHRACEILTDIGVAELAYTLLWDRGDFAQELLLRKLRPSEETYRLAMDIPLCYRAQTIGVPGKPQDDEQGCLVSSDRQLITAQEYLNAIDYPCILIDPEFSEGEETAILPGTDLPVDLRQVIGTVAASGDFHCENLSEMFVDDRGNYVRSVKLFSCREIWEAAAEASPIMYTHGMRRRQ